MLSINNLPKEAEFNVCKPKQSGSKIHATLRNEQKNILSTKEQTLEQDYNYK